MKPQDDEANVGEVWEWTNGLPYAPEDRAVTLLLEKVNYRDECWRMLILEDTSYPDDVGSILEYELDRNWKRIA